MQQIRDIHFALLSTIKYYNNSLGKKGDYHFYRLPQLSDKEIDFISFIYNNENLRPRMYKLKKTNEFIPMSSLVVPKDYSYYSSLFKTHQMYYKYKKSLKSKGVIIEIQSGFILNHKMFPFKDRNTMSYLHKFISMPLPPIK